jgi:general L-amino acid transport system permease protein
VVAGVLRLSKNWLVRKLMAIYVEAFRNVPVLIWILIIFSIMTAAMPAPRAFRGEDARSLDAVWLHRLHQPRRLHSQPLWGWVWVVVAIFLASIIGVFAYRRYAKKLLYDTGKLLPMGWPSLAILFVPTLLRSSSLGRPITLEYPELAASTSRAASRSRLADRAVVRAGDLYRRLHRRERARRHPGDLQGPDRGRGSLGLRPGRIMNLVILPQALRVIIPPLISQYLNLTKNSSLAIAVGYMDVTGTLGGITLNQTGRAIEAILLLMLFYLIISLHLGGHERLQQRRQTEGALR